MLAQKNVSISCLGPCKQIRQLRLYLGIFLALLTIPLFFLVRSGIEQSQEEQRFKYLWHSQHVVKQINDELSSVLHVEENRPAGDYHFFKLSDDQQTLSTDGLATLSPLASIPDPSRLPGIIGYFQVDEEGLYSCPLVPLTPSEDYLKKMSSLSSPAELSLLKKRLMLRETIRPLLIENGFIHVPQNDTNPEISTAEFTNFIYKDEDSMLKNNPQKPIVIRIESLQVLLDNAGHIIFFRNVWKGKAKLIQGFVVNSRDFLINPLQAYLEKSNFGSSVTLQLTYTSPKDTKTLNLGHYQTTYKNQETRVSFTPNDKKIFDIRIDKTSLISPLSAVTLEFTAATLPFSATSLAAMYLLLGLVLIVVMGSFIAYRLGLRQLYLNEERLNFVSAVSHELKTPLTSIIMHAEMLREGMIRDEVKKMKYYNYIFFEGERLGRLIANVLHFSKLDRDAADITLEYTPVRMAMNLVQSKTSTLIETNHYTLNVDVAEEIEGDYELLIDKDAFVQIGINLVDNAIKFSKESCKAMPERQRVDIALATSSCKEFINFSVRDYGPGIEKNHTKNIFKLFYRAENELTRQTKGTGIGLALVKELAQAMGGKVFFSPNDQGVTFTVQLRCRRKP